MLTSELVILDDICVLITTSSTTKILPIDFRFWLNVNYIPVTRKMQNDKDITVNDLIPLPRYKTE